MFIFIHLVKYIIFMIIYQDYEAHCYQLVQSSGKGWIIVTVWYMDAIFLTKGGVRIKNIFLPHIGHISNQKKTSEKYFDRKV